MLEFLTYIKENSKFYNKLWSNSNLDLNTLPIVDQEQFWNANEWSENSLLTSQKRAGVVFKSGGTTGRPKFSIFTKNEWEEFTTIFGKSMDAVLSDGDRVANLFYSGELYASFLFIEKSIEKSSRDTLCFPIAGDTAISEMIKLFKDYEIDVLAGVPTTFMALAEYMLKNDIKLKVKKILFGGEALFEDQLPLLNKAFNQPQIKSVGYASVDAGHLGGSLPTIGSKAHTVLSGTVMQIVDEQGTLINEPNRAGRLLMTNLTRRLMPIVRYPVGDLAEWIEPGKSFNILGRSSEGARVGPVTINRDDIAPLFSKLDAEVNFQLVIKRFEGKDKLLIRFLGELDCNKALDLLYQERGMIKDAVQKEHIAAPEFVKVKELEKNSRTGKLKFVIDERF